MKTSPQELCLTQTGLIDKVLAITSMTDCNGVDIPSTTTPIGLDTHGDPFIESWQYNSVIGMLMYLSTNTGPDIVYAIHQAACFSHAPWNSHAVAVCHKLQYLKKTKTMGLRLKPTSGQCINCYIDADFAGLFAIENNEDPISVKAKTSYEVLYKGSPLHWVFKMQTQIALSTMEVKYIALFQAMHDLIPISKILKEFMYIVFGITPSILYHMHSKAFTDVSEGTTRSCIEQSTNYEDNQACLKFACMTKLSPQTKHIGIPYNWFHSKIVNLEFRLSPWIPTHNLLTNL